MECKLCGSKNIKIIYHGIIRNGGLGKYTEKEIPVYQCTACNVIWHDNQFQDSQTYYESAEYRNSLEGSTEEKQFYLLHDKETLDKLLYTGTDIFRDRVVADIGCGCGAFLDFLKGVAGKIIAVEPSKIYRDIMQRKGYIVYPYTQNALVDYANQVEVVTSFDVIEHVDDPKEFIQYVYELLRPEGVAIIGTPTDAPIMRKLLGDLYERKLLFSTQHLWIFDEKNLRMMAQKQKFDKVEFKYFQRYGIGNMLGWLRDKKPGIGITDDFISATLDGVWKGQCSDRKSSDYIVMYLTKG